MPGRVLVIDDSDETRRWVSGILRRHGYEVGEAADGRTGLAALRDHPDTRVIVLDLLMPNGDAWWFREQQASDPVTATVPVIVLSIAPATETLRYSLKAHRILHKFPEADELFAAIEAAATAVGPPV
jgi:CheY-like chemotaxis protein